MLCLFDLELILRTDEFLQASLCVGIPASESVISTVAVTSAKLNKLFVSLP